MEECHRFIGGRRETRPPEDSEETPKRSLADSATEIQVAAQTILIAVNIMALVLVKRVCQGLTQGEAEEVKRRCEINHEQNEATKVKHLQRTGKGYEGTK